LAEIKLQIPAPGIERMAVTSQKPAEATVEFTAREKRGRPTIISDDPQQGALGVRGGKPPRRTPDLSSSRERLELLKTLASELATIKQDLNGFCTAEDLRRKHPGFILWKHIDEAELKELVDGDAFTPKAYAENLTLRKFGITSRETLKKDRRKLRVAQRVKRP
jgi:hypothetical protein